MDRMKRAALIALVTTAMGLFCCLAVFFLLWGTSTAARLLPGILFFAALAASLPVVWLIRRKK